MHRIDTESAVNTIPEPEAIGVNPGGFFAQHDFDKPGTTLDSSYLNSLQEELFNVVFNAGNFPNKEDNTQLYTSIQDIITNGALSGLYLDTDLDVLNYAFINLASMDFTFNLSGNLVINADKINVSNDLIVGNGDPVNAVLDEPNFISNSATALSPFASVVKYLNKYLGNSGQYFVLRGNTMQPMLPGTVSYFNIGKPGTANDPRFSFVMPYAGIIMKICIRLTIATDSGSTKNVTYTIAKNGADTALTATLVNNVLSYDDVSGNYVSIVPGDYIQLKISVPSGSDKYPSGVYFHFEVYPLSSPP